jgi:hypothetical protein
MAGISLRGMAGFAARGTAGTGRDGNGLELCPGSLLIEGSGGNILLSSSGLTRSKESRSPSGLGEKKIGHRQDMYHQENVSDSFHWGLMLSFQEKEFHVRI